MAKLIAVTSCPTGIAHSLMAAEAIKKTAALMGHAVEVEIHGAEGTTNRLSPETIAADTHVDPSRFGGKRVYTTSVGAAVKGAAEVIQRAKAEATVAAGGAATQPGAPTAAKSAKSRIEGPYKHLVTGVSYMLPIVVAGGLCIALSFVFGIEAFKEEGTLAAALMAIGAARPSSSWSRSCRATSPIPSPTVPA